MMDDFTPTERKLPPTGVPIYWIAPGGQVVRGRYAGGAVWYPDESEMYVYYTPVFWREVPVKDLTWKDAPWGP